MPCVDAVFTKEKIWTLKSCFNCSLSFLFWLLAHLWSSFWRLEAVIYNLPWVFPKPSVKGKSFYSRYMERALGSQKRKSSQRVQGKKYKSPFFPFFSTRPVGLEPTTTGFGNLRSTNWTKDVFKGEWPGFSSPLSPPLWGGDEGRWIGMTGFEPATSCSQNRSATKLRYTPVAVDHLSLVYLFFFLLASRPSHQLWWRLVTVISIKRCPAVAASLRDEWSHDEACLSFPSWPGRRQGFLFLPLKSPFFCWYQWSHGRIERKKCLLISRKLPLKSRRCLFVGVGKVYQR